MLGARYILRVIIGYAFTLLPLWKFGNDAWKLGHKIAITIGILVIIPVMFYYMWGEE